MGAEMMDPVNVSEFEVVEPVLTVTAPDALHAAHGVALVSEVLRVDEEDPEEVWVDCALPTPVLTPWTRSPAPVLPCRARWRGDLWMVSSPAACWPRGGPPPPS
jgi:hypothetical protein